jgi:polysaccharide biosynthesis protein PslH
MNRERLKCLYLATFDPTVSATGTSTRGKFFLKHFCEHYDTHVVHLNEKHSEGRDHELISKLKSYQAIDYSPLSYFFFSRGLYRVAAAVLREHEIDFVFADFEKSGWYARLLSRKFGVPYIYSSHNVEYLRYIDVGKTNKIRYLLAPYMYLLEKRACMGAIATVAISDLDAGTFRKWVPPEKLVVMPCAFDEAAINPWYEETRTDPPIILMVGNYRNAGNLDGAYIAFRKILPEVLKQRPDVVFRFIGKDFPKEISHPNVESAGFVADLMREYAKAAVVIAPIMIGGGIKIKVIEALASGKPLVTTEKGMEGIDGSNLENLVICQVEQFAEKIVEFLKTSPPKTSANWSRISASYGTRSQLAELSDRIDRHLAANVRAMASSR